MNKKISDEILDNLKKIIINPKCELDYKNGYELLVAVILSAQTKDKKVNEITKILFSKYKDPKSLKEAIIDDVINIIKPLGLAKNKAFNIINMAKDLNEKYNDVVPNNYDDLIKLSGVGRKTANVILIELFNIPAFPVDTHLIRMSHIFGYSKSINPLIVENDYKKYINEKDYKLAHHLFLLFGRYHCNTNLIKKGNCQNCKMKEYCKKTAR